MKAIGIRELRQHASRYLREVERGEILEIRARGRPVALLVPTPNGGPMERLAASGRVEPAVGDLLELGPPLKPASNAPLPSQVLADARAGER